MPLRSRRLECLAQYRQEALNEPERNIHGNCSKTTKTA